jgi:hypothetical protein
MLNITVKTQSIFTWCGPVKLVPLTQQMRSPRTCLNSGRSRALLLCCWDGLLWRSRVTETGRRRVDYYSKCILAKYNYYINLFWPNTKAQSTCPTTWLWCLPLFGHWFQRLEFGLQGCLGLAVGERERMLKWMLGWPAAMEKNVYSFLTYLDESTQIKIRHMI